MNARILTFTLASLVGCSGVNEVSFQGRMPQVISVIEEKDLDALLQAHQEFMRSDKELKGINLLKEDEYVLPDEVVEAFERGWYPNKKLEAYGFYLVAAPKKETRERLKKEVNKLKISKEEKEIYLHLFTYSDAIIFKEQALKQDSFKGSISHERTHQYWYTVLTDLEREILGEAYEGNPTQIGLKEIEIEYEEEDKTTTTRAISEDYTLIEFYPNLVDGTIPERVTEQLQIRYPVAYEIFERMEKTAKKGLE